MVSVLCELGVLGVRASVAGDAMSNAAEIDASSCFMAKTGT